MATKELAKRSSAGKPGQTGRPSQAIDPADEPSVGWGWHGGFPKGTQIYGWITVLALLAMLFGNHQGILSGGGEVQTADLYLIGIALVVAIALLVDIRRRRRISWRR